MKKTSAGSAKTSGKFPKSKSPRVRQTWRPEWQTPAYPFDYGLQDAGSIRAALARVLAWLDKNSPAHLVDCKTGRRIAAGCKPNPDTDLAQGLFRLVSYEWGVVYCGMMQAAGHTGDSRYSDYAARRLQLLADATPCFKTFLRERAAGINTPAFISIIHPHNLDDAGSLCAAMIKAHRAGLATGLLPIIENFIDHILNKQYRLDDGIFARNRPMKNSVWLDDLYMSVPALAQMYTLTGNKKYAGEAIRQLMLFSKRMFNPATGLFMHGWLEAAAPDHPEFHWGRSNGWAMLAMVELLDELPAGHPGCAGVLALLQAHIRGVAKRQGGRGFWHQLLDRNDSYEETSATAIFTYCIARAINKGWANKLSCGPVALAGWNAVASRIDGQGRVHGTCVGTGMAMDPVYYYYRPQSELAAHSYGPVLLAGAELLPIIASGAVSKYDSACHFDHMFRED
ncbi:MAG: glycoside hydrolase family 88 protein [Opitutaceae bacterium]|jgi:rhamnogalacturonyl hydrolase YesR|nr:glycoside hydrolase family 88 protein [Opitutaceae bacterium]